MATDIGMPSQDDLGPLLSQTAGPGSSGTDQRHHHHAGPCMGAGATPVSTLHKAGSEKTKASEGTFYGQIKEKPGEAIPLRPRMGPLIPASWLCGWKDPCVSDGGEWGSGSSHPSLALCSRHGCEVWGAAG